MKKSRKAPARKRPIKRARSTAPHQPARATAIGGLGLILQALPPIGTYWKDHGGVFQGLMIGQDNKPDYALISAIDNQHTGGTFDELQEYARKLSVDGRKDFTMPTRKEQRVQFANAKPGQFKEESYWSGEQYADSSDFACCQSFFNGHQSYWHKVDRYRGCAVRRVPIR